MFNLGLRLNYQPFFSRNLTYFRLESLDYSQTCHLFINLLALQLCPTKVLCVLKPKIRLFITNTFYNQ